MTPNLAPLSPDSRSLAAAYLVRDAMAVSGLDALAFAAWLRLVAADLEQRVRQ